MKEKERMLDNKSKNLKLKKISKKESLQEKGITLIALVVTIIILLILAGVTLNIALSDNGLFNKTKEAAEKYKQEQSNEEEMIRQIATQMYSEYVGAKVSGYNPSDTNNSCDIGTSISGCDTEQKITRDTIAWRIWDYDGTTLRIVGDPTTAKLTLQGPEGYNNGVWILDNICNTLYSNDKTEGKVTNLKRTDIQKVSTYDYSKYKHVSGNWREAVEGESNTIQYGESKTSYTDEKSKYPEMWETTDKNWTYEYNNSKATGGDKEGVIWEKIGTGNIEGKIKDGTANTKFKQSYYAHNYKENEFINDNYYDLIFKDSKGNNTSTYWLESRYVSLDNEECNFGLSYVGEVDNTLQLYGFYLCSSGRA